MRATQDRETHTLREILSQPQIWRGCCRSEVSEAVAAAIGKASRQQHEWLFVGCGSSFYLAEAAACCWGMLTGLKARAIPGSEVLLFPKLARLADSGLQAVAISRSGKTSETVRAARKLMSEHQVPTIGLTCAPDSELGKVCNATLALPQADEKSMVMTLSFTAMLLALLRQASELAGRSDFCEMVETISGGVAEVLPEWNAKMERFVAEREFEDYVYLGQGPFFPIAREGALKITEMSQSYAQAYHTLEFRHGPKSLVTPRTCLMFFLSETGMEAESEMLEEMKELGGAAIAVCNRANEVVKRSADLVFELGSNGPETSSLAPFVVPAQLLGFHTADKRGLNPDEPRNLTRVVILD